MPSDSAEDFKSDIEGDSDEDLTDSDNDKWEF
jgi:hypothetical protein